MVVNTKPTAELRDPDANIGNLSASNIQTGTGTSGTPVVYSEAFSSAPVVVVTNNADAATVAVSAEATTGHTVTASAGTPTYHWIAIGTI